MNKVCISVVYKAVPSSLVYRKREVIMTLDFRFLNRIEFIQISLSFSKLEIC